LVQGVDYLLPDVVAGKSESRGKELLVSGGLLGQLHIAE